MRVGLILPLGDEPGPGVPASFAELTEMAVAAEAGGLDSLWVYDHLLSAESPDAPPQGTWEAWSVLSALAARTTRVGLGTLVCCTSFRHPGLMAKMAHTVAEISGDRLILGLGAGWHEPEYTAFGFPFDHRVDRFAESIEITATLLRSGMATVDGQYWSVRDCPVLPARPGRPAVPILVGCKGERMLGLTARWADAWNTAWYGRPNDHFHRQRDQLAAACEAAGRDPGAVEVTVGMIFGGPDPRLASTVDAVVDALGQWRDLGVGHVIGLPDPTDHAGTKVLIEAAAQLRA